MAGGRWPVLHAAVMAALLALVPAAGSALPVLAVGAASLAIFFVRERPAARRALGLGAANAVTLTRLALLVAGVLAPPPLGLALFAAVLALDGVDGWLARRLGEATPFGAQLDLETDALFVATLSALAVARGLVGPWLLLAGLLRYLLVLARQVLPGEAAVERRSSFGRYAFVVTVVLLLVTLADLAVPGPALAAEVAVALLLVSFSEDFVGLRPAVPADRRSRPA